MTIIVLGYDALEHKLVKEYKLSNLKQKSYTKLDISDFPVISTPPIWASMITGEINEEMISYWVPEYKTVNSIYIPAVKFARKILPSKVREFLNKFIRNKFYKERDESPLQATLSFLEDTETPTIFSELSSWHNEIPGYNATTGEKKKKRFETAFEDAKDEIKRKATMKLIKKQHEKEFKNLLDTLDEKDNYDLIFWYTKYLDEIGHMDRGSKLRTMRRYMDVNKEVGKVKSKLDLEDKLYIISDHGMKPEGKYGLHDKDAFFSSSDKKLIRKPQELYELIRNNLKM